MSAADFYSTSRLFRRPEVPADLVEAARRHGKTKRTKAEMAALLEVAKLVLEQYDGDPITVRHFFYRLASDLGLIDKTEAAYKTLDKHLVNWRRKGLIPYEAFVDSSRWHRGPVISGSMAEAVLRASQQYRIDLFRESGIYLEVWTEKDAISSLLVDLCASWNLSVFPFSGFTGGSALFSCAQTFRHHLETEGRRPVVLYFGDHDPSGKHIDRSAEKTLRNDHGLDLEFRRLAILPEQIDAWNLPTRPLKKKEEGKKENSHAKGWKGDCVEIDVLSSAQIRALLEAAIADYIDADELARLKAIEAAERQTLRRLEIPVYPDSI